jgi:hypothetical protein
MQTRSARPRAFSDAGRLPYSGRTAQSQVTIALTVLGMIASVATLLIYLGALKSQVRPGEYLSPVVVKPQSYYLAHTAQIVFLLTGGFVAFISTRSGQVQRGYLTRFWMFLGASFLMTVRGYSLGDLLSTKLADDTGPLPCLISMLIFFGAQRRNWMIIERAIVGTCILFSALVLVSITRLESVIRAEAAADLGGLLGILYMTGAWVALREYAPTSRVRHFRFVPVGIFALASILTETRLNFVLIIALLGVYAYLQRRRGVPQASTWVLALSLGLWAGLFIAIYLRDTPPFRSLEDALTAFLSRLDEDTRTGQLRTFMEDVPARDLLLGRGSFATWNWGGMPWRGLDLGYVSLLFFGGVPLLFTYIAVHLVPCFAVLKGKATSLQLSAAGMVVLWAIAMFSSVYPNMNLQYYLVLFCVGACISREDPSLPAVNRAIRYSL